VVTEKRYSSAETTSTGFPQPLYIRGTFPQPQEVVSQLDMMRDFNRNISCLPYRRHGNQKIERILTDYRDAIQFVHDQAIRE